MAAWSYVKRMRRLNLTGKQPGSVADGLSNFGSSAGAAGAQLTTLLGTTFGSGLSSLTKGARQRARGCQLLRALRPRLQCTTC